MNNNISIWQKIFAGILLIAFTVIPAFLIIGYWPDRLPTAGDSNSGWYHFNLLHVELIKGAKADSTDNNNSGDSSANNITVHVKVDTPVKENSASNEISTKNQAETNHSKINATIDKIHHANICQADDHCHSKPIHINTILLLLVALAGFLGNMIHIATSFTTYVGAEQFKRSWLLWYFVKPFTASALAVGIYFVFRGGFLNMSDDSSNINLYGIMTISLLAGLFTDRATQKLKEVFEVLFKPNEERPNPLIGKPLVKTVSPLEIEKETENILTLNGENLDAKKLIASINDEIVGISDISKETATIKYKIPDSQTNKTEFILVIKDEEGNTVGKETLKLKEAPAPAVAPDPAPANQ